MTDYQYPNPCPHCGSTMYDNTRTKRSPKAPDYKCSGKQCDPDGKGYPFSVWLEEPNGNTGAPRGQRPQSTPHPPATPGVTAGPGRGTWGELARRYARCLTISKHAWETSYTVARCEKDPAIQAQIGAGAHSLFIEASRSGIGTPKAPAPATVPVPAPRPPEPVKSFEDWPDALPPEDADDDLPF